MKQPILLFAFYFTLFFNNFLSAQPFLSASQITTVGAPVDIASPSDSSQRLFIVEKAGYIRIYDQGSQTLLGGDFLDIHDKVSDDNERGLLGLAFHPDYANNGYFFVNYTDNNGDTQISRFTVNPPSANVVDTSTELSILFVDQPRGNHNAGDLAFGLDGYLYIPLGDGGGSGDPNDLSQNPETLLGKIVRIDIDSTAGGHNYAVPADNPYIGVQMPTDTLDEIWATGLRNPWRCSFDRLTGDFWIADVGQWEWEEVNVQPANSTGGENYGWRCYEGNHVFNISNCDTTHQFVPPVFEYPHIFSNGGFSITGGLVYRGSNQPDLQGWYVVADYVSDNFWLIRPDGAGGWDSHFQTAVSNIQNGELLSNVSTFGEDENGELFVASLDGGVYAVMGNVSPCPVDSVLALNPVHQDTVSASNELSTKGEVSVPSNVTVVFRAGMGMLLDVGFTILLGADFHALIEDCE